MSEEAFNETLVATHDEFGNDYRWLTKPNPDAPDCGIMVEYQEWEPNDRYWKTKQDFVIGIKGGKALGEALIEVSDRIAERNGE